MKSAGPGGEVKGRFKGACQWAGNLSNVLKVSHLCVHYNDIKPYTSLHSHTMCSRFGLTWVTVFLVAVNSSETD